ncbi:MAG: GNAT family N-acetyltransferase [Actinomycetota bacterium]
MARDVVEVELRDGSRALVRPIRPDDKERLRVGLAKLSPQSRYLRFHTPVVELTDEQLRYLTEVDFKDHVAWVAIDPYAIDEPGMGVARYVRLDEETVAEAAITVADAYQGRGVGSLLLGILARSARENGIETFRSYVLSENIPMLRIFERLGASIIGPEEDASLDEGVTRIDLPLPEEAAGIDDEVLRKVMRHAATRDLPPLPIISRPIWRELRPAGLGSATAKRRGDGAGEDGGQPDGDDAAEEPRSGAGGGDDAAEEPRSGTGAGDEAAEQPRSGTGAGDETGHSAAPGAS